MMLGIERNRDLKAENKYWTKKLLEVEEALDGALKF